MRGLVALPQTWMRTSLLVTADGCARTEGCNRFKEEHCPRLEKAPYVCNGCPDEARCRLRKFFYIAREAHKDYRKTLVESREGVNLTEGEKSAINEVLVPALNKGQSVHHAMVSAPDAFGVCERTIYGYVNDGVLDVKRHNLPMAVRYKKRNGKPVEHKVSSPLLGRRAHGIAISSS